MVARGYGADPESDAIWGKLLLAVLLLISVPWLSLNLLTPYSISTYWLRLLFLGGFAVALYSEGGIPYDTGQFAVLYDRSGGPSTDAAFSWPLFVVGMVALALLCVGFVGLLVFTAPPTRRPPSHLGSLATTYGIERLFGLTGDGFLAVAVAGTVLRFLNYFAESLSFT